MKSFSRISISGLIILLFVWTSLPAQELQLDHKRLDLSEFPSTKPTVFPSDDNLGGVRYSGIFAEDDSNRVWFFNESEVWFFSLTDKKWIKHSILEGFNTDDNVQYNSVLNVFIVWSANGSSVKTWKPGQKKLSVLSSLDQSPIYKYHSGNIDTMTGRLFAFGGRGYGVDVGLLWNFDLEDQRWTLVPINKESSVPSGRHSASMIYSAFDSTFHVFGGGSFKNGRSDFSQEEQELWDYWVFDVQKMHWSKRDVLGISNTSYDQKVRGTYPSRTVKGVIDNENGLIWHHYKGMKNVAHSLLAYDIESGNAIHIPVKLLDGVKKPILRHLSLDPETGDLILFWSPWVSDENQSVVDVSITSLPEASVVRSMINEAILLNESVNTKKDHWKDVLVVAVWITLVLTGGFSVSYLLRAKIKKQELSKNNLQIEPMNWHIVLRDQPTIRINGKDLDECLSKPELHLLCWMSWKYFTGQQYQLTDTIEEFFFDSNQNLDYVRKQRNSAFKRINEQLSRLSPKHLNQKAWILDRYLYEDKRKREYALDLDHVNIEVEFTTNESGEVILPPTITQRWILDMQDDVSKMNKSRISEQPKTEQS